MFTYLVGPKRLITHQHLCLPRVSTSPGLYLLHTTEWKLIAHNRMKAYCTQPNESLLHTTEWKLIAHNRMKAYCTQPNESLLHTTEWKLIAHNRMKAYCTQPNESLLHTTEWKVACLALVLCFVNLRTLHAYDSHVFVESIDKGYA